MDNMITPIRERLGSIFRDAFAALGAEAKCGDVVLSQKPELGQFQCNGAMAASKQLGKNPREVAEAIIAKVTGNAEIAGLSIAGPGFINIKLSDSFLGQHTQAVSEDQRLGVPVASNAQRIVIDFGGPNVAKPMHVGHLRSSIIGAALVRIMKFLGNDVLGDIHHGDWGLQMGMVIEGIREKHPELVYFDESFKGTYPAESPVGIAELQEIYPDISGRAKTDETLRQKCQLATVALQQGKPGFRALWKHLVRISIEEMKQDFGRLGVEFDLWYGESDYEEALPALIERIKREGHAVQDQGAWIINVVRPEDKKPVAPVILVKTDGGTGYATTDIATVQQRVHDLRADLVLYVVDARQADHFEQVFRAAQIAGVAGKTRFEHLGFGTMNGADGKPFKTRAGGVMRLKDLIQMMTDEAHKRMMEAGVAQDYPEGEKQEVAQKVGLAALKYADLQNMRTANYVFDIERFTRFEGKTGSYLLYAAVRCKSVLRKAKERGFEPGAIIPPSNDAERDLMLKISNLPDAVYAAADQRMPHHLCSFVYELASEFSRFWDKCHILTEEDPARRGSWLGLTMLVLRELEMTLGLLGIEVPERM